MAVSLRPAENLGAIFGAMATSRRVDQTLARSEELTRELQVREEELKASNEELLEQTRKLEASQTVLRTQQEELQAANEELEEKGNQIEGERSTIAAKNRELEFAQTTLRERAEQLALTSKYKSEFLANMSHELRTPLNSLLILSKMLADNAEGNLTDKQVEYAQMVHSSGVDLLELINEILDLSKIEAGSMAVDVSELRLAAVGEFCEQTFRPLAEQKKLGFRIEINDELPSGMRTDARRVHQILKNLLSNAFKFTEKGDVLLTVHAATKGWGGALCLESEPGKDSDKLIVAYPEIKTGTGYAAATIQLEFGARATGEPNSRHRVDCDTQMQQVLINLATNAMQAIGSAAGRIDLRLDTVELDAALVEAHPALEALHAKRPGRTLRLAVSDDGPGMDAATLARVFEPFFTTKPVGQGTGLGLAVVHGIVQAHEGAMVVKSQPGKGPASHFTCRSPKRSPPTEREASAAPNPASPDKWLE